VHDIERVSPFVAFGETVCWSYGGTSIAAGVSTRITKESGTRRSEEKERGAKNKAKQSNTKRESWYSPAHSPSAFLASTNPVSSLNNVHGFAIDLFNKKDVMFSDLLSERERTEAEKSSSR
jgi:hypothetical protein